MHSSKEDVLIEGDITQEHLALATSVVEELQREVTHVFHLAAIYDLAVEERRAELVNVGGTSHVNQWVGQLEKLERYVYFSTAYVAGKREGLILETELEKQQSFKNHYERTKYEAEVLVEKVKRTVPTTIIRPGIVVGHSQTGETIKFDGPYFMMNFFDKLKFLPLIPYVGAGAAQGNFVPVDYIIQATVYLAHESKGVGQTYHLTDPRPYTMKEVYRFILEEQLGRKPRGMIPVSLVKRMLRYAPLRKWAGVEQESMDYFTCQAIYDSTQAQEDLKGSGIACPDFKQVLTPIVQYYLENKHDQTKQIHIH
nr:SDR family oxidoreductase [Caldalkalibacillus mannanilyticus]